MFNCEITVAIPVYERYEYFEDCINSAINQEVKCNIIVVDNNSSHASFANFIKSLDLPYVKFYRNENNIGAVGNWNKCIELSKTKWVTILHSDDMLSPFYIKRISEYIDIFPDEVAFLVKNEVGDIPGKIFEVPPKPISKKLLKSNFFLFGNRAGFPGNIINKEKLDSILFRSLKGASDYIFWYELSIVRPLFIVNEWLSFYRTSSDQDSATMDIKDVVISPTYWSRNNIIGFRNKVFKFFSLYELYLTYLYYQKIYKRSFDNKFQFDVLEITNYFRFFNSPIVKYMLQYPLKGCLILLRKFS